MRSASTISWCWMTLCAIAFLRTSAQAPVLQCITVEVEHHVGQQAVAARPVQRLVEFLIGNLEADGVIADGALFVDQRLQPCQLGRRMRCAASQIT